MEKTLQEDLRFERLMSDISARFINIYPDRVDAEIENALREVLEFFEVDRCGLLRSSRDSATWQVTHAAFADGIPTVPVNTDLPVALFPWAYRKLIEQGEMIFFNTLDALPAEAHVDRQTYSDWGIRSSVDMPISVDADRHYIFSINAMRSERAWPEEYIPRLRLLGEIFVNALLRAQARLQLEERLRMERLLATLSARFLHVLSEQVEAEIENGLEDASRFLGVELGILAQFSAGRGQMVVTHSWAATGFEKKTGAIANAEMPWIFRRVMRGKTVACERLDDLPAEAEQDKKYLQAIGSVSNIAIPLVSGGEVLGFVGFDSLSRRRDWPGELVRMLRVVAQVFASALARKRADMALRESEARLDLAAASANAGLWVVDFRDGRIWMTDKTRELFSFAFLDIVHPEDRPAVRRAVQQAIESGRNESVEYRAVLPDGRLRWMISRGKAYFKASGEPDHVTGVTLDITENKKMQEQLNAAAEEWKTTFDSVHDMVMILDREHRIRRVNAAAAAFFGLPQEQIIGASCHCLMHGMDSSRDGCPAVLAFQTGQHEETELLHE
jgi:PAS domain S-box-containing protein